MAKEQDKERKAQGKTNPKAGDAEPKWKASQRAADVAKPSVKYANQKNKK